MLVITRKPGQKIIIDDKITITLTRIKGKEVRIAIDAPPDVRIEREERVENRGNK